MMSKKMFTFEKQERLTSKTLINKLFVPGSQSISQYPVRMVTRNVTKTGNLPQRQVLISVSKRHFKRAVIRNRIKRQIREAYRKHKYLLSDCAQAQNTIQLIAFLWIGNEVTDTKKVEDKVQKLLQRLKEQAR